MSARPALARLALCAVLGGAALGGCAGASASRRGLVAGLRLRCTPVDATVTVDDELRGGCALFARQTLPLGRGTHRVEVDASGYFPWYAEVDTGGIVETLEVELVQRPD